MIFTNKNPQFKSNKEDNFYYKVFSGYLFNELLLDQEKSREAFFNLLRKLLNVNMLKQHVGKESISGVPLPQILHDLTLGGITVSFDYHLAKNAERDINKPDRGEMSNIEILGEKYFARQL
jgi:hypothetical protein